MLIISAYTVFKTVRLKMWNIKVLIIIFFAFNLCKNQEETTEPNNIQETTMGLRQVNFF
jgi:hypothetical protein